MKLSLTIFLCVIAVVLTGHAKAHKATNVFMVCGR